MELCRDVRPIHRSAYGTVPENKKVFYEGSLTIFYDWTICNAKHIENEAWNRIQFPPFILCRKNIFFSNRNLSSGQNLSGLELEIKMKRNVRAWKKNKVRKTTLFAVVLHSPPLPPFPADVGKASPCDIQRRKTKRKDMMAWFFSWRGWKWGQFQRQPNNLVVFTFLVPRKWISLHSYGFMNYLNEYHMCKEGEWPLIVRAYLLGKICVNNSPDWVVGWSPYSSWRGRCIRQ